jgi:predicted transcriptional regulator YdeE
MHKSFTKKMQIKLAGIGVRTSYAQEQDREKSQIIHCVQRYFHQKLFEQIPHRVHPGTTFCAYTEYESDYKGAYTYFIGEEVSFFAGLPEGFRQLLIPAQSYVKFTTNPAPMPQVVVNAWQAIWKISSQELGGERLYLTDFELYDERAADHQKVVLDLYIGVRPEGK